MSWTPKDPSSVEHFAFDFSQVLEPGDALSSLTAVTIDSGDNLLVISNPHLNGSLVVFTLSGGTTGTTYALRAEAVTGGGETLELTGILLIRRTPY